MTPRKRGAPLARGVAQNIYGYRREDSTAQPVGIHAKAAMFALIQRQPESVRKELTAWAARLVGGRDGC